MTSGFLIMGGRWLSGAWQLGTRFLGRLPALGWGKGSGTPTELGSHRAGWHLNRLVSLVILIESTAEAPARSLLICEGHN